MADADKTPTTPIMYDGKVGELYKIFLLNIFLGIITLGIYHFWGKTRTRRYVTSSFSIQEDRFEYTGYGSELFWGFIKTLILLMIISIPLYWASYQLDKISHKFEESSKGIVDKSGISQIISFASTSQTATAKESIKKSDFDDLQSVFNKLTPTDQKMFIITLSIVFGYLVFYYIYLPFVAVYTTLRYRASRTRWRGVRGKMRGLGLFYGFVGIFHTLLTLLTLGLWKPFADAMTYQFKMNRFYFGSQNANLRPTYLKLLGYHLWTLFLGGLLLIIPIALCYIYSEELDYGHSLSSIGPLKSLHGEPLEYQAIVYGLIILSFMLCFLPRYWYKAALIRVKYNCLTFGNLGFKCTMTGWSLLKLQFGNFLILVLTLGLGSPIVTQRRMKYFCRHVTLLGDVNQAAISQATGKKDKTGEGLGSLFDMDIGLF